jgi:dihydroorotate dehydrogenase electron transfer subunit
MLKYLALYDSNGCVSLEARMGCGFGACMGCSIKTTNGTKRVCKEGPVFEASEVIF